MNPCEGCGVDYLIVCSAFRYALGRKTYVVGCVVDYIVRNWGKFDLIEKESLQMQIREAIKKGEAGDFRIDVPEWEKILKLPLVEEK